MRFRYTHGVLNSMLEFLTGDDVYSHIVMSRTASDQLFLVVEGPSDYPFFNDRVDLDAIEVVPAYGRDNLIRVVEIVDQRNEDDVMGLRDRDFVGILEPEPSSSQMICTDDYDLDATLIQRTTAAERVVAAFSDPDIRAAHVAKANADETAVIVRLLVADIGYLRLASQRHNLGLSLRRFPVQDVTDVDGLRLDEAALVQIAKGRSPECDTNESAILEHLRAERSSVPADSVICGHDAASLLALLISRAWGGHTNSAKVVLASIHAAVPRDEFTSLELATRVEQWANQRGRERAWVV